MDAKLNNLIIGSDEDRWSAIVRLFQPLPAKIQAELVCLLFDIANPDEEAVHHLPDPNEQPEDNG